MDVLRLQPCRKPFGSTSRRPQRQNCSLNKTNECPNVIDNFRVASFEYDGYREISRAYGQHDLKRTQSWTTFREPDQLKYLKNSTSALLTGFDNAWNSDGQITVRERLHDSAIYDWGEVYRYDEMGRLVKMWTNTRNPQSFSSTDPTANYDDKLDWSLGKVYEREDVTTTPEGGSAVTAGYTNNAGYQYTHIASTPVNLTWDSNGQLTDWGTTDYAWTALGQMSQAAVSGETARDYEYDAFGRRVKTLVGSVETQMLYHGWHMIGQYDDNNSKWLWQEVPMNRGEGMIEHVALDTNDMDDDSNTTEYLGYAVHEDWQNTVWALSNASGAITERYVQDDPFGASTTFDASSTSIGSFASEVYHHKRMHGGVVEPISGLYDFRNRWYSPVNGSWLSRDPLGQVDSQNLYQGFGGNTLIATDVFGLTNDAYNTVHNGTSSNIEVFGDRGTGDGQESFGEVSPGTTFRGEESQGENDVDVVIFMSSNGTWRAQKLRTLKWPWTTDGYREPFTCGPGGCKGHAAGWALPNAGGLKGEICIILFKDMISLDGACQKATKARRSDPTVSLKACDQLNRRSAQALDICSVDISVSISPIPGGGEREPMRRWW